MKKALRIVVTATVIIVLGGCGLIGGDEEDPSESSEQSITLYIEKDGQVESQAIDHNDIATVLNHVPRRFGYSLEGFYSITDVDDIDKEDPETISLMNTKIIDTDGVTTDVYSIDEDYHLGLKWTPDEYTLQFNLEGGELSDDQPLEYTFEYGDTLPDLMLDFEEIRYPGYYFDHWNSRKASLGDAYSDNDAWLHGVETFDKETFEDAFEQSEDNVIKLYAFYTKE